MKDGVPRKPNALRLIAVAGEDGVDRLGIGVEVAVEPIDIDAGAGQQFADPRLGQLRI